MIFDRGVADCEFARDFLIGAGPCATSSGISPLSEESYGSDGGGSSGGFSARVPL